MMSPRDTSASMADASYHQTLNNPHRSQPSASHQRSTRRFTTDHHHDTDTHCTTTLNLLLAASPAMAELAAHLPLSLPSLTAGVYFFPVSTSARVAPGRLAYGAPIRVADPVGVWAVEAPAAAGASPAACRPAEVQDIGDDRVARRCDGAGPGGLLVSMKDSGVAFACYCGASEDAADEEGPVVAARTEDQRGWNKRNEDDDQRGWNKRSDDDDQRGWNKRSDDDDQRGWNKRSDDDDQRGWNKRSDDDSTDQMTTTGVQRGWHKRNEDDQRGWNKRSDDESTEQMTTTGVQRGWNKRNEDDQRGWNKRSDDESTEQMTTTGVQRGWNKRHADDQRGWNRVTAEPQPETRDNAAALQPEDQRGWNKRADAAALEPQDQRGWNRRADATTLQPEDQRGWNKRRGSDKPIQATGVQRGWHRRSMAQRGML